MVYYKVRHRITGRYLSDMGVIHFCWVGSKFSHRALKWCLYNLIKWYDIDDLDKWEIESYGFKNPRRKTKISIKKIEKMAKEDLMFEILQHGDNNV